MTEGTTSNGISYEWGISGPKGARFILYPEKDKHTEDEVKSAIREIRGARDVASMQVRWRKLGDDTPNPEKIPDYLIIKGLQQKVGELEAHVLELDDKHKKDLSEEKRQIRKEIQSEQLYDEIKKDNSKLKRENTGLRQEVSRLIAQQRHPH